MKQGFPEQVRNLTSESRSSLSLDLVFTMSKIGHLQNCLEEIFDEFTPKFEDFSDCEGSQERS